MGLKAGLGVSIDSSRLARPTYSDYKERRGREGKGRGREGEKNGSNKQLVLVKFILSSLLSIKTFPQAVTA